MARYADPAWEIGMALGNAYGNMWAANAKKRQEEKAERIISDMMGGNVTGEDVNAAITSGTGMLEHQNRAGGVTAQDVQAAIRGWPTGLTTEDMRNNLRKNKINQEVIDKVMPGYEKQMREAMTAKFLPQIMGSLYGEKPDYGNAMQQAIALSKYDPDTAKLLMAGIPTGRDVYKQKGAETLKGLGSLNRGKTQYSVSTSDYNSYVSRMNAIEKFYDEQKMMNENYELPADLRAEYNTLSAMKQTYLTEHANQLPGLNVQQNDTSKGIDFGNWHSVEKGLTDMIRIAKANGATPEEIKAQTISVLDSNGVSKDSKIYARALEMVATPEDKAKAEAEKKKQTNDTLMWGGKGLTNTVGDGSVIGTAIAEGKPIWDIAHR